VNWHCSLAQIEYYEAREAEGKHAHEHQVIHHG
jgi:hypothetical protein